MNIWGKVLLGLVIVVIVGAAVSMAFTARMIHVRNSWMKAGEELRQANVENAKAILAKEAELAELRSELKITLLNWGTPITGFNVNQASAASINLPIGARHGIVSGQNRQPPGENPLLQAFRPSADGDGYVWVGPLQVQNVTDTATDLVPTWTVREAEAEPWTENNQRWRVWQRVPPGAIARFTDLQRWLIEADATLADKEDYLVRQQGLLDKAQAQRQVRLQELLGPAEPPEPPADPGGMEYTHGLLSAIAAEEEARNAVQAETDRLRRELKEAYATLQRFRDENVELIKQLPQPPASESSE